MPPVVLLFVAAVLVLAQFFHLLFPRRVSYLRRVLLAFAGVAIGEFIGSHAVAGPRVGELHTGWDLLVTGGLQLLGNRFLR